MEIRAGAIDNFCGFRDTMSDGWDFYFMGLM